MSLLYGVPSEQIDTVWPEIQPMVQRALTKVKDYRFEPEDIRDSLKLKDMQLWVSVEETTLCAMLITQLLRFPRCLECDLFMWSGRMTGDWRRQLAVVEQWATEQGCHYMSSHSRPGSAKFVGYEKGLIQTYRRL